MSLWLRRKIFNKKMSAAKSLTKNASFELTSYLWCIFPWTLIRWGKGGGKYAHSIFICLFFWNRKSDGPQTRMSIQVCPLSWCLQKNYQFGSSKDPGWPLSARVRPNCPLFMAWKKYSSGTKDWIILKRGSRFKFVHRLKVYKKDDQFGPSKDPGRPFLFNSSLDRASFLSPNKKEMSLSVQHGKALV